ncbi:hypothetical protein ACYX79_10900 [Stenotrophomonas rhizophila]
MGLTLFYLATIAAYAVFQWEYLLKMDPNEFGDFLAGAFGPVALFWLVCGYFQQSAELRQNTRAIRLQADALEQQVIELRLSVEHQEELVRETRRHVDFATEDGTRRDLRELQRNAPVANIMRFESFALESDRLFTVTLRNDGASVVVLDVTSDQAAIDNVRQTPWETSKAVQMRLSKKAGFLYGPGVEVRATIHYRDHNGTLGTLVVSSVADNVEDGFQTARVVS